MANSLVENGYTDKSFINSVLERENASTTCFNDIAIPHAMTFESHKTAICVSVFKDGINWDNQTVYVIFLISVNKADSTYFKDIFGGLIELFNSDNLINRLKACQNFYDFKRVILEYV